MEYVPNKIEQGVPVPPLETLRGRHRRKYMLLDMAVGDSFLIPGMTACRQIKPSVKNAQAQTGFKYTTRKLPEGVRVWRTE